MIQLPKFSQYYIVSIIFPGVFNALIVLYTIHLTFCPEIEDSIKTYEWSLLIFSAIILTLVLGMIIESVIFEIVAFKKSKKGMVSSYNDLENWRDKMLANVAKKKDDLESRHLVGFTEKLMSEYYCLNNIIVGIIISMLVLIAYFNYPTFNVCALHVCVFVIYLMSILLLMIAMRTWLHELYKLQN